MRSYFESHKTRNISKNQELAISPRSPMASTASLGLLLFFCLVAFSDTECRSSKEESHEASTGVQPHDWDQLLREAAYRPFRGDFWHGKWRHHGRHYRRLLRRSGHRLQKNIRRLLREWRRYRIQGGSEQFVQFLQWLRRERRLRSPWLPFAPNFLLWWLRVGRHRFDGRWPEGIQAYSENWHPEINVLLPEEDWLDQTFFYRIRNYPHFPMWWRQKSHPGMILHWSRGNVRIPVKNFTPTESASFDRRLSRWQQRNSHGLFENDNGLKNYAHLKVGTCLVTFSGGNLAVLKVVMKGNFKQDKNTILAGRNFTTVLRIQNNGPKSNMADLVRPFLYFVGGNEQFSQTGEKVKWDFNRTGEALRIR
ncbi:hypothetical protein V5799_019059 [Amblyomma americanum]|uniref:Uncharacterized protein n=1 Tax=Amblyomma americanum TaxID=6943 RepID=A0AAQ4EYT5_AMBAM